MLADLSSWEAWLHLAGALRREGFDVVRFTRADLGRTQRVLVGMERFVFTQTHPVLLSSGSHVDVAPLFPWLKRSADVQMVDAIGAELTATAQWAEVPRLHRVHASGIAEAAIYDKWIYTGLAERAGVTVPDSRELPEQLPAGEWVLKGRVGSGGDRVRLVSSTNEVEEALRTWGSTAAQAFIQAKVGGDLWNVGGVAKDGEVLVAAAYRAFSAPDDPEGPPVDIQIQHKPDQLEATRRFVAALGYTGPFAIDFLDDGVPYLLDFNPRFFGTWAAMQSAGVDLLGAYLAVLGQPRTATTRVIDGARIPSSVTGQESIGAAWRRGRDLGRRLGPTVGPRATTVLRAQALATGRRRRAAPSVAIAYSEPWLAAMQWGGALRHEGVQVSRYTVAPLSRMQRVRQSGEELCFHETHLVLRDHEDHIEVMDPELIVEGHLDVQMTERVLAAMVPTAAWQDNPQLHHVPTTVDQALLYDKDLFVDWAGDRGLPVPQQCRPGHAPKSFPVIVKPATGYGGVGVTICHTAEELSAAVAALGGKQAVVQQFLPGRQVNVGGVAHGGRVLLAAPYEPLPSRSHPTGPPVALRTLDHPEALEVAAAALRALEYTGPFCLDLVTDSEGRMRIVDLNARVFGSWTGLQRAGLDLVGGYLHTLDLRPMPTVRAVKAGAEYDVDADPQDPLTQSLTRIMSGMVDVVGVRGVVCQTAQIVAKHARG